MLKLVQKFLNSPEGKKLTKKVRDKNIAAKTSNVTTKTSNVTTTKFKPVKYAAIGIKQMRMGNTGTVLTSSGLLANQKITIKKKTLLGR